MNKLLSLRLFWLGLFVAVFLSGCATAPQPNVEVSVINLQFANATLLESQLTVDVRISNSGPTPIAIDGGAHKLYLNGHYVGQGLTDQKTTVPRLGSATQTVQLNLQNLRFAPLLRELAAKQIFSYKLESAIYLENKIRPLKTETEGTLDISALTGQEL